MTLKWTPAASEGLFSRGEIEIPVARALPDLSLFGGEMGELVRRLVGDKPLEARYETRVSRVLRLVNRAPPASRSPSTRASSSPASARALCAKSSWN